MFPDPNIERKMCALEWVWINEVTLGLDIGLSPILMAGNRAPVSSSTYIFLLHRSAVHPHRVPLPVHLTRNALCMHVTREVHVPSYLDTPTYPKP